MAARRPFVRREDQQPIRVVIRHIRVMPLAVRVHIGVNPRVGRGGRSPQQDYNHNWRLENHGVPASFGESLSRRMRGPVGPASRNGSLAASLTQSVSVSNGSSRPPLDIRLVNRYLTYFL